ncbi:cytochrome C [Chitinophagaceae bacterium IBVUCB1]|jgi:hypothetical protein|nr:cytochrome C [Chitinophagaceae bacterium IBVUCB1]
MLKKILIGLLVVFVIIQFIRPEKNTATAASANDISTRYTVPDDVNTILQKACNDCHTNNTTYPWYSNIQPVGWWLQNHVNEGKAELNFSEFAAYKNKKAAHKMEEVVEMVEAGEMPLRSYTIAHTDAKLTSEEKATLVAWAKALHQQIKSMPAE